MRRAFLFALFFAVSVPAAWPECVDIPSEKETTDEYIEYKEVVRPDTGCHFFVYARQFKDPELGWLENGYFFHRKTCPCGLNAGVEPRPEVSGAIKRSDE